MSRYSRCSGVSAVSSSQLRHADDAVHGRADLVAHVGEELALGPLAASAACLACCSSSSVCFRAVMSTDTPSTHGAGPRRRIGTSVVAPSASAATLVDNGLFAVEHRFSAIHHVLVVLEVLSASPAATPDCGPAHNGHSDH